MRILRDKLLRMIPILLLVSVGVFLLTSLMPGDPAAAIAGEGATPEQVEIVRVQLGFDDPWHVRYGSWLADVVRGDLGRSYRTNQPVLQAILQRLPVSLQLILGAQVLAMLIAVPLAVLTAHKANSRFDRYTTTGAFGLISVPPFVLGLLLIFVFAVQLGWLPATGWVRLGQDVWGNLRTAFLPTLTLSLTVLPIYQRLLRGDMLATLQQDYILMAKSKGLSTRYILARHALRPSSFSLITLAGVDLGRLIGGSVIIEFLFAIPGVGMLLLGALYQRDFIMLQGAVLLVAAAYVIVNTAVDLLYSVLDPRIGRATAGSG